ncbi:TonB-dependent receptor [Catalinimonas niigatensis]|uniref:TonB-dependent receptor n=1 Tax=Catalinimonas niigatensis TaxID=1397264 RepID=UPI0026664077|nr:TonB-dependent receptor [Catalinimonas niigatensis]WPP51557.1 TonB-dependent receptor [Catalinimonas niigatensis]
MKISVLLALTVLTCFITYSHVLAQSAGQISGFVKDAKTEEPLIGVTIKLENSDLGGTTDLNGYYQIQNVPAKTYNVTASYVGYQSSTRYNIVVRSGGNPDLNFSLDETTDELNEVVIQASPFEKLTETPNSIQRLSQEEIATYPGGNNDIAKVVQSLPGVSGSVGFRNDVIIRGGAPNENVYYLDGVEIPNINHFATQGSAGGPVGLLNVSFIEGVTLSTSSFPAQYDNVLSGVLQFDQRNGNAKERKTNIRISGSEAALTFEGPLVKPEGDELAKTTFITSIRRSYLQLLFKVIDLPFLPDYWDYQYKVNHKIDERNELNLTGIGSIDNFQINPPDDYSLDQQATLDQVPVIKQWTSTIGLSWRHRLKAGNGFFRATVSGNILSNTFTQYADNVNQEGILFNNESEEDENKFRFEMTNFAGDWTISSGVLAQYSRYTNDTEDAINNLTYQTNTTFYRFGLFGQVSRSFFGERFTPSFGIRTDGNTFLEEGMNVVNTLSPRLSLSYVVAPRWTVNGSIGRYFKIPPYTVLGYKNNQGEYTNKDTEYIQSDHLVAGLEFLPRKSTRLTLEGFYKRYDHYPVSIQDGVSLANLGGSFEVLGNEDIASVGLGRSYGMEFLLQQKLSNNFYGILAYTLYWSEFTGPDRDKYLPSVWDNRHLLTFTGGYKLPNNWEIGLRVRYLGPTPYPVVDLENSLDTYPTFVFDYDQLGEVRLGAYNQADIRIDKKWNFTGWTFNLFLEVTNVLGSNLPNPPTYSLERSGEGEIIEPRQLIEVPDTDNSAILPTIGIIVDF